MSWSRNSHIALKERNKAFQGSTQGRSSRRLIIICSAEHLKLTHIVRLDGLPKKTLVLVREKHDHLKAVARKKPTEHEKSAEGSRDDGGGKGGADVSGLRRADS